MSRRQLMVISRKPVVGGTDSVDSVLRKCRSAQHNIGVDLGCSAAKLANIKPFVPSSAHGSAESRNSERHGRSDANVYE